MSDPTAPVEGTSTEAAPEPASDPYAPVLDRVNELATNLDGRFAALEQRIPAPEPEAEPDPWAALFPEQEEQFQQEPQGLDPQALQSAFQQALEQANAPLREQMQQMQQERQEEQWAHQRERLYQTYPHLKDPQVAQETTQNFNAFLMQSGATPEHAQWMSNNPQFIGMFIEAAEAKKLAQGQAPASDAVPSLEAAGGAVPGGNGEPPSYVNQAMNGAWSLPKGLR